MSGYICMYHVYVCTFLSSVCVLCVCVCGGGGGGGGGCVYVEWGRSFL